MKEAKFLKELIDIEYTTIDLPKGKQKTIVYYSDITYLIGKYRKILSDKGYQLQLNGKLKKIN